MINNLVGALVEPKLFCLAITRQLRECYIRLIAIFIYVVVIDKFVVLLD